MVSGTGNTKKRLEIGEFDEKIELILLNNVLYLDLIESGG
jgi:hypothetical protein